MGHRALRDNTTGIHNTAVGFDALKVNTTGQLNTSVGYESLVANTTASSNQAFGRRALYANTTGTENNAFGYLALDANTTGSYNTAVGVNALGAVTTGSHNIGIGQQTGNHGVNLTTGVENILIGNYSDTSAADSQHQIAIGYNVSCSGNDNFTFGYATTDSNIAFGATSITAPSDIRLKEDIEDEKVGLDFINDLRPVTFRWKKAKDVPSEMKVHDPHSEERVMNGKYNHGFIAQEVKEVIDRYDLKDGFDMWTEDEADGRQRIGEASLMPLMVKAVQELSAKVEELESKLNGE